MNPLLPVKITWLATARPAAAASDKYFDSRELRSFLRQFDLSPQNRLPIVGATPRDGFHRLATRAILGAENERTRAPYPLLFTSQNQPITVRSVTAREFPSSILALQVSATSSVEMDGRNSLGLEDLVGLRSSKSLDQVRKLIDASFALYTGAAASFPHIDFQDYFLIEVEMPVPALSLRTTVEALRRPLVGMLIGSNDAENLDDAVLDRVIDSNYDLNSKARTEVLLANRQGAVLLRPSGSYTSPHPSRPSKIRDLAILGQFAKYFLDTYREQDAIVPDAAADTRTVITRWVRQPQLVFQASVSNTLTWKHFSREFLLDDLIIASN
jgi:hypothetical protein